MRITVVVSVIVGLLSLGFLLFGETLEEGFVGEKGLAWLREQGSLAGFAGAGLIASDLLLPMPASGITAALGEIYGGVVGGIYASLGSLAGGLSAYGLVRLIGHRALDLIAGEESRVRLQHFFDRKGVWAIAITRVLPVVPEVLCCLAGIARMPFRKFFLALVCGSLPFSFLFSCFGSMGTGNPLATILIATLIPALLLPGAWWLIRRMEKDQTQCR